MIAKRRIMGDVAGNLVTRLALSPSLDTGSILAYIMG